uniref:Uncharacterized protein n=1 Tax=Aegilops tauschii TaxID=37682 RepID=M8D2H3_AEGTA
MSVQCTANSLRALAALPAPSPSRRLARNECLMPCRPSRTGALVRAADSSPPAAPASSSGAADDKAVIPDDEFTLAKVSGLVVFLVLESQEQQASGVFWRDWTRDRWLPLVVSSNVADPIVQIREIENAFLSVAHAFFASQYAELKPVPCITYSDAFALREKCATPILKQA